MQRLTKGTQNRNKMKPTYRLKILDKSNSNRTTIGAGWLNYDGSITIQLTPAVALDYESCKDKVITLFPEKTDYSRN